MSGKRERVRIFFIGKKWWTPLTCLCLAAVMFYVVNYPAAVGASAAARQLPIYCVQRDQKLVAISFDAAWGDVILRDRGQTTDRTCHRSAERAIQVMARNDIDPCAFQPSTKNSP